MSASAETGSRSIAFRIAFVPCSKKNQVKRAKFRKRGADGKVRTIYSIRPTELAERHEQAIRILALAELALGQGRIDPARARFFHQLADARAGGDIDEQTAEELVGPLRRGAAFGRDLVSLEVREHIGRKPGTDYVDVTVSWLEPRPSGKRRTGLGHDLINIPAIIADAIQGALIQDDDQIVSLDVRRIVD